MCPFRLSTAACTAAAPPQELYGSERTSIITAALSRLFTAFLQANGFTCGMADVFLVAAAEETRAGLLQSADVRALDAAANFVGLPSPTELVAAGESFVSDTAQAAAGLCSALLCFVLDLPLCLVSL